MAVYGEFRKLNKPNDEINMFDSEYDPNSANFQDSIDRFEKYLQLQEDSYFDIETLEQLAEHYLTEGKLEECMKACEMGLKQQPYHLELILFKVTGETNAPKTLLSEFT